MSKLLFGLLLCFSISASAQYELSFEQRALFCDQLLRADQTLEVVSPPVVSALVCSVYDCPPLGVTEGLLPLGNPLVQSYVSQFLARLRQDSDPELRRLSQAISSLELIPKKSVEVASDQELSPTLILHATAYIENELNQLPLALRQLARRSGRRLLLTLGPITLLPELAHLKGLIPPGWDRPWDEVPGISAGHGGSVINVESLNGYVSVPLHEVLHDVDNAHEDFYGVMFSKEPKLYRMWETTDFRSEDAYLRINSAEAFAELGAWYFNSSKTRERLRDFYPAWHSYFERLDKRCAGKG